MQLLYSTAQGLGFSGPPENLYDPDVNIFFGTKLLRQLIDRYGENLQRVYSAYNSGRPDLYLTSSQVGRNVQRLLANLERFLEPILGPIVGPIQTQAGGAGILALATVAGLALLRRKKGK
jgi:MYXO-CTERM domain-containing protein